MTVPNRLATSRANPTARCTSSSARARNSPSAPTRRGGACPVSAIARAVVIALLDIPIASVLVFETLILAAAIFHHSNLALPRGLERALSRLVITPSIHWVHHHAKRGDTDSNYGTIFSFWDPVFGSRSAMQRKLAMPIGVEGQRERPVTHLLLRPFLGEKSRA